MRDNGVEPKIVNYIDEPLTVDEIAALVKKLGVKPADILRKKDVRAAGLDLSSASDKEVLDAMGKNPKIIERPIVVSGKKAAMGRPPENVLEIL